MDESQTGQAAGPCSIAAAVFDYGGVLAEEGFRAGLAVIGRRHGYDPDRFHDLVTEIIFETGYLTGKAVEADFWRAVRERLGVSGTDEELRREILPRFVLRPWMIELVDALRGRGVRTAILSDQTDWLEFLDNRDGFRSHFDLVWNSYRIGKSKRDPSLFDDLASALGLPASEILFIDDSAGHIGRAAKRGLKTIHYTDRAGFERAMRAYCPSLSDRI